MPRKTKIGTDVAHVMRDSDSTFKVKRSKVKVTCEAGHIVAASRTACFVDHRFQSTTPSSPEVRLMSVICSIPAYEGSGADLGPRQSASR